MSDPNYAYPYPAQGYYQGSPVMAPPPPQYVAQPQYAAPAAAAGGMCACLWSCLQSLCCCGLSHLCCPASGSAPCCDISNFCFC